MRSTYLLPALFLTVAMASVVAQEPADGELCLDEAAEDGARIAACTRLIDAGTFGTEEAPAAFLHGRADVAYYAGDYEQAVADLHTAIAIDPENAELYSLLGHAFLWLERDEEARTALETATELDPASYWEYTQLGFVLMRLGELDLALESLNRALELRPSSSVSLYYRGRVHERAGRDDLALADYTTGLEFYPFDDDFYVARGQIYFQAGDMENTLYNYRIAYLLNPNRIGEGFLNDRWPAREIPADPAPFEWRAPEPGLRITYLEVDNNEKPFVDPMQAAIDALVAWFSTPEEPLPIGRDFILTEILGTDGDLTEITNTVLYETDEEAGPSQALLLYSMLPLEQLLGGPGGPPLTRDWQGLDEFWPLIEGSAAAGDGDFLLDCPENLNGPTIMLGCAVPGSTVAVGSFTWSIRFDGWEDVLVPIGRRLAAKITYEEAAVLVVLGREIRFDFFVTWWLDPEYNWPVRRHLIQRFQGEDLGVTTTREAIVIEAPAVPTKAG